MTFIEWYKKLTEYFKLESSKCYPYIEYGPTSWASKDEWECYYKLGLSVRDAYLAEC